MKPLDDRRDEDEALDAWLASLELREVERFLSALAETPVEPSVVLEPIA